MSMIMVHLANNSYDGFYTINNNRPNAQVNQHPIHPAGRTITVKRAGSWLIDIKCILLYKEDIEKHTFQSAWMKKSKAVQILFLNFWHSIIPSYFPNEYSLIFLPIKNIKKSVYWIIFLNLSVPAKKMTFASKFKPTILKPSIRLKIT